MEKGCKTFKNTHHLLEDLGLADITTPLRAYPSTMTTEELSNGPPD
jgi:hypothetical protein